jgi:hypothetical protein
MNDEQRIKPTAGEGEPSGVGPEVGADVQDGNLDGATNLVIVRNVGYLVLSWSNWDTEGFYVLGVVGQA